MVYDFVVSVKNSNPCPYSLRDLEGSYVVHTSGRDRAKQGNCYCSRTRARGLLSTYGRDYEDGRTLGLSLALTQAEVAEMLEALEENDHRGLSPSDVAIMPRDLAAPVSRENAAFVHEKTRRALLSKLKQARKLCGLEIRPEAWKRFLASVAL